MIRWWRRGCRNYFPGSVAWHIWRGDWSREQLNIYLRYTRHNDR